MKAIYFVFCLCTALMFSTVNSLAAGEDFKTFLRKFTSSASFQYSRIKFPLKSPIVLLKDDGETEQTFPFTRDKWALLDSETLQEGRITEGKGESIFPVSPVMNRPIKSLKRGMMSRNLRFVLFLN